MKCENCGTVLVVDHGAYVCPNCGYVYEDLLFEQGAPEYRAPDLWGHGTVVLGPSSLRGMQIQLSHTAVFVAMLRARRLMKDIQSIISLSAAECDAILAEFHRVIRRFPKGCKGVSRSALLLALVYLWLKERGRRVNLRALVAELKERRVRVSLGDVMRALAFLKDSGLKGEKPWRELLEHYSALAARVFRLNHDELLRRAIAVLEPTRRKLTGRNRENVAAAIVYICVEQMGGAMPLFRFSRLTGVPVTSLRNNVLLVRSLMLEEGIEEPSRDFLESNGAGHEAEEASPVPVNDPASSRAEYYSGNGEQILLSSHKHRSA